MLNEDNYLGYYIISSKGIVDDQSKSLLEKNYLFLSGGLKESLYY